MLTVNRTEPVNELLTEMNELETERPAIPLSPNALPTKGRAKPPYREMCACLLAGWTWGAIVQIQSIFGYRLLEFAHSKADLAHDAQS